jgi:hypothetical protein
LAKCPRATASVTRSHYRNPHGAGFFVNTNCSSGEGDAVRDTEGGSLHRADIGEDATVAIAVGGGGAALVGAGGLAGGVNNWAAREWKHRFGQATVIGKGTEFGIAGEDGGAGGLAASTEVADEIDAREVDGARVG